MMKYKVGDRVKVREDLKLQQTYGSYLTCNDSMVKKAGLVVTIKECDNVYNRYKIDADDWNWNDEMFEGLASDSKDSTQKEKFKVGDKLRFVKEYEFPLGGSIKPGTVCEIVYVHIEIYTLILLKGEGKIKRHGYNMNLPLEVLKSCCEKVEESDSEECFGTPEGEANEITNNGNTIRPRYYKSAMGDVFDIANAYGLDMPLGTAVKYILRAGKKDKEKEIEDLQKAVCCIERAIELRRDQH